EDFLLLRAELELVAVLKVVADLLQPERARLEAALVEQRVGDGDRRALQPRVDRKRRGQPRQQSEGRGEAEQDEERAPRHRSGSRCGSRRARWQDTRAR